MFIIKPIKVSYETTNVGHTESTWVSGPISAGTQVNYAGSIWESVVSSNNDTPSHTSNKWLYVSVINSLKPFDGIVGFNPCRKSGTIEYSIVPDAGVNSIVIFNLKGTYLTVKVNGGSPNYEKTIDLIDKSVVYDWFTYFFSDIPELNMIMFNDLVVENPQTDIISIEIGGFEVGETEVGEIVLGEIEQIGVTKRGVQYSFVDYSRKETDTFGNFNIIERPFTKRVSGDIFVFKEEVLKISSTMSNIRTTPVVWVFSDLPELYSTCVVYGYYRDFSMVLPHLEGVEMSLEVEGLT